MMGKGLQPYLILRLQRNLTIVSFHVDTNGTFVWYIAGMFGGVIVWQITELKVAGEKMFAEWINFGHKDTIYELEFGRLEFGKSWMIHQTC